MSDWFIANAATCKVTIDTGGWIKIKRKPPAKGEITLFPEDLDDIIKALKFVKKNKLNELVDRIKEEVKG